MTSLFIISYGYSIQQPQKVALEQMGIYNYNKMLVPLLEDNKDTCNIFLECVDWIHRVVLHNDQASTVPVILIQIIDIDELDPQGNGNVPNDRWNAAVAMLFLAFPEIRWVFHAIPDNESTICKQHCWENETSYVLGSTLFDSKGLRKWVLEKCNQNHNPSQENQSKNRLRIRKELAAAIDDEEAYSFFHAYVMYRFGYRCYCLTTLKDSLAVLREASSAPDKPTVSLEDVYISFPDSELYSERYGRSFHLSDFRKDEENGLDYDTRQEVLPGLSSCNTRIIISVAHAHGVSKDKWKRMESALKSWKSNIAGNYTVIKKPTSGIFDLWKRAKLDEGWEVPKNSNEPAPSPHGGPNEEKWYQRWRRLTCGEAVADGDSHHSNHSAPGRLKLVAEVLLRRALERSKSAQRIPDILTAAVLAMDAYELAQETPTIAVEALALMHTMEVKAECEFPGVSYGIIVAERLKEIENESEKLSRYVDVTTRESYKLNVQARVITKIMRVFNDYKQFDEEQICLAKLRTLHSQLELRKSVTGPLHLLPLTIIVTYINILLKNPYYFVFFVLLWPTILGLYYYHMNVCKGDLFESMFLAVNIFTAAPVTDCNVYANPLFTHLKTVTVIAKLLGLFHLGVLFSHLYNIIRRR